MTTEKGVNERPSVVLKLLSWHYKIRRLPVDACKKKKRKKRRRQIDENDQLDIAEHTYKIILPKTILLSSFSLLGTSFFFFGELNLQVEAQINSPLIS